MNLQELAQMYVELRDADASTGKWLSVIIRKYERHLGREASTDDFSATRVNDWAGAMLAADKLSRRTVHSYRRGLLILWRFAIEENIIDEPLHKLRRIKLPKLIPRAWSHSESEVLLIHANAIPGMYRSVVPKAAFWKAFLLVIWDSGLRLGDALRLKFSDFSASGLGCMVQNKTGWPKPFQLSPAALSAIEVIRCHRRELVFGGVVSRKTIYKTMRKLTRNAGLSGGTKKLRKSGATAAESKHRGSATAYLGHQDRQIAYDFYVDPTLLFDSVQPPPPLQFPPAPPEAA